MKTTLINATTPGQQIVKQRRITLDGDSIDITQGGSSVGYGSLELFQFPAGHIMVLGVVCESLRFTGGSGIAATGSGDYSVGTTATADATLSSTDADLLGSKALVDPFVARVGDAVAEQATISAPAVLNGAATAAKAYLNVRIDAGDCSGNTTATLLGTFLITYIELGDN